MQPQALNKASITVLTLQTWESEKKDVVLTLLVLACLTLLTLKVSEPQLLLTKAAISNLPTLQKEVLSMKVLTPVKNS